MNAQMQPWSVMPEPDRSGLKPRNALALGDYFRFSYDDAYYYQVVAIYPDGTIWFKRPGIGGWGKLAAGGDVWVSA